MAENLTANFGANVDNFSAGVLKMRQKLVELNTAMLENRQAVSAANKELKALQKQQAALAKDMKDGGTKEQKAQMQDLSDAITQANLKLGRLKTNETELKTEIKKTSAALTEQKAVTKSSKEAFQDLAGTAKTVALGYSAIVAAIGGLTISAAQSADEINTLSATYSISAEQLQKFQFASELVDVSLETMTSTMTKNIRSMAAYKDGTAATVAAYDTLKVKVTDGNDNLRDSEVVYNEVLTALGKMTNETERDALAMQILGKSAQELNPLILAGVDAISQLGSVAESMGLILSDEQLAALNTFNDKLDTSKAKLDALKMVVGAEFANTFGEAIEGTADELVGFVQELKDDGTLADIANNLKAQIESIVKAIEIAVRIGWQFRDVIAAGVTALIAFKTSMAIGTLITNVVGAVQRLSTANVAAAATQTTLNAACNANPYVLLASAVISVCTALGSLIAYSTDGAVAVQKTAEELNGITKSALEETKAIDEATKKYQEIINSTESEAEKKSELKVINDELINSYGVEAGAIDTANLSYDEQLAKLQDISAEKLKQAGYDAQAGLNQAEKEYNAGGTDITTTIPKSVIEAETKALAGVTGVEADYSGAQNSAPKLKFKTTGENAAENVEIISNALDALTSAGLESGEVYNQLNTALQGQQAIVDEYNEAVEYSKAVQDATTKTNKEAIETVKEQAKSYEELTESSKELVKSLDDVAKAYAEQKENGSLSYNTIMNLIDAGYATALQIDEETNSVKLNTEAYKDLAKAKIAAQIIEIDTTIASKTADIQANITASGGSGMPSDVVQRQTAAATAAERAQRTSLQGIYDDFDAYFENGNAGSGNETKYDRANDAYKTAVENRIELINDELDAKKELRDYTIAAIDEEIKKRKELNEDTDMQEQIDAVNAQLKYSQLDEFSRSQLNKKLADLKDEQAETVWQREMQDRKDAANATYEAAEANAKSAQETLSESVSTVKQIMDSLEQGITNISNIVNSNNNSTTNNTTANVTLPAANMTVSQIATALKQILGTDVLMR